mgnify:CR=1 FL=1
MDNAKPRTIITSMCLVHPDDVLEVACEVLRQKQATTIALADLADYIEKAFISVVTQAA